MQLLLVTLLLVGIAVLLLSVRVLFKKNGRFINTHVSANKAMRDKGVSCALSQDRNAQKKSK